MGSGLNHASNPSFAANAVVEYNGDVIVGGYFTHAGGVEVNYIARWDGQAWYAMGAGFDAQVNALIVHDGQLIAGGDFTFSGQTLVRCVAAWNGGTWQQVGGGIGTSTTGRRVSSFGVHGGLLVAGGRFTVAGGVSANRVAILPGGGTWQPLGNGVDGNSLTEVSAIASYNGELYIGGNFTSVSGVTGTARIARWSGGAWNAVGGGNSLSNVVHSLYVYDNKLFVGGLFLDVGGNPTIDRLAAWNGSTWSSIGIPNSTVLSMTTYNGHLIIGGQFQHMNGMSGYPAIARYDGAKWLALGGGLDNHVYCVYGGGQQLLAAGGFNAVAIGKNPTTLNKIGRWQDCTTSGPGDITGDGIVNIDDLLVIINGWGQCPMPPPPCTADIHPPSTGNGVVDIDDLLVVINGWTPPK